jgi:hypothetical protein
MAAGSDNKGTTMPSLRANLVRDSGIQRTADGYRCWHTYLVENLTATTIAGLEGDVLDALPVGYGDPLDTTNNLFLLANAIEISPLSGTTAKATVTYFRPSFGDIDILIEHAAGTAQQQTDTDVNGDKITVTYWFESADVNDTSKPHAPPVTAVVSPMKGVLTMRLSFHRTLDDPLDDSVESTIRSYHLHVNSDTFRNGAAGTWLCTSVEDQRVGTELQVRVTMTFQYRPEGWKEYSWFRRSDGQIPQNVDKATGNGVTASEHYESADFQSFVDGLTGITT